MWPHIKFYAYDLLRYDTLTVYDLTYFIMKK